MVVVTASWPPLPQKPSVLAPLSTSPPPSWPHAAPAMLARVAAAMDALSPNPSMVTPGVRPRTRSNLAGPPASTTMGVVAKRRDCCGRPERSG